MNDQMNVKQDGSTLTVTLGKELSTANAPILMEELNQFRNKGVEKVVFDATNLNYIASSGIRTIIFAKQKLGSNPTIEFVNCAKDIYEVFEMTGLEEYINFVNQ